MKRSFPFLPLVLALAVGCGGGGGGGGTPQTSIVGKQYARLTGQWDGKTYFGSLQLDVAANNQVTFLPTFYMIPTNGDAPILSGLPYTTTTLKAQPDGSYLGTGTSSGFDYILTVKPPVNGERQTILTLTQGASAGAFGGKLVKGDVDNVQQAQSYLGDVTLTAPAIVWDGEFRISQLGDFVGRLRRKSDPTKYVVVMGWRASDGSLTGYATFGGPNGGSSLGGTFDNVTNQLVMKLTTTNNDELDFVGTLTKQ